jgi:nucleoside-diphosphate-sugar epimerase
VIGVDNLASSTGDNLSELLTSGSFEFHESSVSSIRLSDFNQKIDYVFHFASPASPSKYQQLGLETIHANTVGTENLIRVALANSARFLFASTSEIYGDPSISPQPEEYWGNVNPIGPRSVYDESKRLGETLVSHFARERELKGSIVRIFNTYGPGMDPLDGRVVSTFIRQALLGEPFTVFGDGTQTRSFCFVDDLVSGIVKMAESSEFGPVNLGNPSEIDLLTLGRVVAQTLGVPARFEYLPLPQDDPRQRKPEIFAAQRLLSWEPTVTLEEGVRKTASWMRESLGIG